MKLFSHRMNLLLSLLAILVVVGMPSWARGGQEGEAPGAATAAPIGKLSESPVLAAKVKSGAIPPVADRLPKEPVVRRPIEKVGKYSSQLFTLALNQGAWGNDILVGGEGANLFRIPANGKGVEPNLAKAFEVNSDNTAITVYLREGAKWSDGAPFTAEDIRFMFDDMHFTPGMRTWGSGGITAVEMVNDMTIKLKNAGGLGAYRYTNLASWFAGRVAGYHPAHYLKQYHIKYNPDANKLAKDNGFDDWTKYIFQKYWWGSGELVGLPQMTPWYIVETSPNAMKLVRNPYYWAVDQSGQQLPYFDEVLVSIVNAENYNLKVIAGEADIAYVQTSLPNIQLYRENEKAGGYTTLLWPGTKTSDFAVAFNPHNADEYKAKLALDVRFREALNLAVDRKEINDTLYFGLAVPRQVSPIPSASYYKKEWEQYYAQFDQAKANKLLDEVGLNKKDKDGHRVRADNGETLSWVIEYSNDSFTPGLELLREHFEAVGLKTTIKLQDAGVLEQRTQNNLIDMPFVPNAPNGSERAWNNLWNSPYVRQWWNYTYDTYLHLQAEYKGKPLPANWIDVKPKAETAKELGWEISGVPAPDWFKQWWYDQSAFSASEPGSKQYMELANKVYDLRVKGLWEVGVVGLAPKPFIVKNTVGNAPKPGYMPGIAMDIPLAAHFIDQLYRK